MAATVSTPKQTLLRATRNIGMLKHTTQKVYRMRYDMTLLTSRMRERECQLRQVQTLLGVQKNYLEELTSNDTPIPPTHPHRYIQLYYDIERREEELLTIQRELYDTKREYAYQFQELQSAHSNILLLIQETQPLTTELALEYNYDSFYKAIQHTIPDGGGAVVGSVKPI